MSDKILVLLVDDDFHWTEDLHKLFALEPSLKLVGTAPSAEDGIQKAQVLKPNVVLVNTELPDGDVSSIISSIKKDAPNTVFIAEMDNNDNGAYQKALQAGASKVILKSAITTGEILGLIRQVWQEAQQSGPKGFQSTGGAGQGQQPQEQPQAPQSQAPMSQSPQNFQHPSAPMPQGYPQNPQTQQPQGYPQAQQAPQGYPQGGGYGGQPQSPQGFPGYPQQGQYPPQGGYPQGQGGYGYPQSPQTVQAPQGPFGSQGGFGGYPQSSGQHPTMQDANASTLHPRAPRIRTTCIAVNSPKGGVGKSSFSKELASAYAMVKIPTAPGQPEDRLKVCVVDMDLDYGNIASMLHLNPVPNISNWAEDINAKLKREGDKQRLLYSPDQFMPYLLTHAETGLKVLAAPVLPTQALDITEKVVEIIIDSLKAYFDIVILDTGNNTKDYTLISLEKSSKTVIVSTCEVPTINNVHALLETMKQIHYPMEKLYLVLNNVSKRSEVSPGDAVQVLELPYLGSIPEEPRVRQANSKGELLVMGKETEYTSSVRKIGHQLVPVFSAKRKVKGKSGGKFDPLSFLRKK